MPKPRLLFAVTVYNGRTFVPACLDSVARLRSERVEVDVLVLDDASPEPGFSDDIRALCDRLGLGYYRSPRNLGIPRNVNLGLLRALDAEYDYVVIANSDIIVPATLAEHLVMVAEQDPKIGSVTAWSNNVSVYSLPNEDPDEFLSKQSVVDWIAQSFFGQFGGSATDVPAGISFCILIPTSVLRVVGLMDPIFGRGYCEETDWTQRSRQSGYRITLAPSCFVYHRGQVSTIEAGVLPAGHSTSIENERIIDHRYPLFRSQVAAFMGSELLDLLWRGSVAKLMADAANNFGYDVEVGLTVSREDPAGPVVTLFDDVGVPTALVNFIGFVHRIPIERDVVDEVAAFFGCPPKRVRVVDASPTGLELARAFSATEATLDLQVSYPTRI